MPIPTYDVSLELETATMKIDCVYQEMQLTKNRHAVRMLNNPIVSPLKYDPAARAVKMMRMIVERSSELVRDQWSDR